jgi:uridine kinase
MPPSKTIIGIAGASGAGKSMLANQLHDRMRESFTHRDVTILNEDCYYRSRDDLSYEERERINYDHPDAIEHELLIRHLTELRNGNPIQVPQYDYSQHNRDANTVPLESSTVLILEGILILHRPELRDLLDLKIFVDVPLDICLSRRLRRDIEDRGRSLDSVLSQYHTTVRPMFFEYIDPSKNFADIIIPRGGENRNALNVLQNHLDRALADSD